MAISHPIVPEQGWHALHLFYRLDRAQWGSFSDQEQAAAKEYISDLVKEIRSKPNVQLLIFSMVGTKADVGFMLTCPDLHVADWSVKQLTASLGPEVLVPTFSWLSLTELSEYATTEEEYAAGLEAEGILKADSPEFRAKIADFKARMEKYGKDRLYPNLADWPVFCFYPMSKRRNLGQNWFGLDFESRKKLMAGHARVGRAYAGKVRQLITGSTGLDDDEWGVSLFAHTTSDIKSVVYEMRFDAVSADYASFGEFYIGLQMPLEDLVARLNL
ncbi:MAG: heme peroxidase [Verrucomicrobia bacterium]|nr:MAG: heme peroxidase [Verrucomicrobiota bacterium]